MTYSFYVVNIISICFYGSRNRVECVDIWKIYKDNKTYGLYQFLEIWK